MPKSNSELLNEISNLRKEIDDLDYQIRVIEHRQNELISKKFNIESDIQNLNVGFKEEVNAFLQKTSEEKRLQACKAFEKLGTMALEFSIGPEYEMIVDLKEIRKKPNANVYLKNKETGAVTNPTDDNGGGLVDIISIALRLVILLNAEPKIEGPIILDEAFKMLSAEYLPNIVEFIKKVSEDFNKQIIMITHKTYIAESIECSFRVTCENGESKVERI